MHPILTQGRRLALYLFLFLQAGLLLAEMLARLGGASRRDAIVLAVPVVLLHSFSCLASWYLCRSLPLGSTRLERWLVTQLVAGAVASALLVGAGSAWATALERFAGAPGAVVALWQANESLAFVYALLLYSLAVAVHYLLQALAASQQARDQALELELLAQGAELRALKAQIDPHFLFNSLNSISALVTSDPPLARQMCVRLASFLRSSLEVGRLDTVPLSRELALVEDYLGIEKIRFGERLELVQRLDQGCADCGLPPLLLQPLVENAIRHGIATLLDGGRITVEANRRGDRLEISVDNPRDPDTPGRAGEGIGLSNVRRRLAARFGDAGRIRCRPTPESWRVELTLPAQP